MESWVCEQQQQMRADVYGVTRQVMPRTSALAACDVLQNRVCFLAVSVKLLHTAHVAAIQPLPRLGSVVPQSIRPCQKSINPPCNKSSCSYHSLTHRLADEFVLQGKVSVGRELHGRVGHTIADCHSLEVDGWALTQL